MSHSIRSFVPKARCRTIVKHLWVPFTHLLASGLHLIVIQLSELSRRLRRSRTGRLLPSIEYDEDDKLEVGFSIIAANGSAGT